MKRHKTIVGHVDDEVLAFTVGKDPELDLALIEPDCVGSAAHVRMLTAMPLRPRLFTQAACGRVVKQLVAIMKDARRGAFTIRRSDQDVHMAIERVLTGALGDLGRRVHTARSRNDQVALDLRLYAKEQLLALLDEAAALSATLLSTARRHKAVPMVGRTHFQPAMPSSVGLWASAYAEGLSDDTIALRAAYALNDRCPLGSAAGYGVGLPVDRALTSRLLGFEAPVHNVLYASQARGKCESVVLAATVQVMLTLSRLAEDLILFSAPELGYFRLPPEFCTGSSIMPQKRNPDVLELVRARAARVAACEMAVVGILKGLPGSYNRDLQETKEPFMEGLRTTRACLRMMTRVVADMTVDRAALEAGFTPAVFATDEAVRLVAGGVSFRAAYDRVKAGLGDVSGRDPREAIAERTHLGAPSGLDFGLLKSRVTEIKRFASRERRRYYSAVSNLLGTRYPELDGPSGGRGRKV